LDGEFEYQGYWWLPGAHEDEVPASSSSTPTDGATLDLLGSLNGLEGVTDTFDPKIILGLSSNGRIITLKDCGRTKGSVRFGSGFATSSFVVNEVFVGEHFQRVEYVGFERLIVEYIHLEAWVDVSSLSRNQRNRRDEG